MPPARSLAEQAPYDALYALMYFNDPKRFIKRRKDLPHKYLESVDKVKAELKVIGKSPFAVRSACSSPADRAERLHALSRVLPNVTEPWIISILLSLLLPFAPSEVEGGVLPMPPSKYDSPRPAKRAPSPELPPPAPVAKKARQDKEQDPDSDGEEGSEQSWGWTQPEEAPTEEEGAQ